MEVGLTLFFKCNYSPFRTIPMFPCLAIFWVTLWTGRGVNSFVTTEASFSLLELLEFFLWGIKPSAQKSRGIHQNKLSYSVYLVLFDSPLQLQGFGQQMIFSSENVPKYNFSYEALFLSAYLSNHGGINFHDDLEYSSLPFLTFFLNLSRGN